MNKLNVKEENNLNINQKPQNDEDNISINSEKIEPDEDKINTPGISSNLIVNASFSRRNHENASQNDQQSIISNLINTKKDDMKSIYSFLTNDPFSQTNLYQKKQSIGAQNALKKSTDEDNLIQYKKLSMLLKEKEKEVKNLRDNYSEYKKKMQKQTILYNKNKQNLDLVRKNNALMKMLICKIINSK